jgi:hypothetical protein
MLDFMTSNDNTAAQTLLFPIQQKGFEGCITDDDYINEYRLIIARYGNMISTGKLKPTESEKEEMRENVRQGNKIFTNAGYKPIYIDF